MIDPGIPKRFGHIWIGPYSPPTAWMETWKEKHPDWEYHLYDNDFLKQNSFRTQDKIEEYWKRGAYAGVADLMRYEILFKFGGFIAGADSICYRSIGNLFPSAKAYTIFENEFIRGRQVAPIYACEPGNQFVGALIESLAKTPPHELDEPWISTGNLFCTRMIEKLDPDIEIFPSHYLIPVHYTGVVYEGPGPVYAKQMFGSTRGSYNTGVFLNWIRKKRQSNYRKKSKSFNRKRMNELFQKDWG